ncbi:MAG TPA: MBL fold metallo-hydrolase [Fibrobacteres bacterium]|jgi:phosphoribosyl 1,2-cyclic phosphodiesterase|nr:MBL fold metallo-hydrolase [Fibrobacterota bacterium]
MFIRCWGARGSIPVSGPMFNKYGGDTTCMEIHSDTGEVLIIDAGSGIRSLGNTLLVRKQEKITILFTHAHIDHLMGLPFFAPLFSRNTSVNMRGPRLNKTSFKNVIADFLDQPYFPVQIDDNDMKSKMSFTDITTQSFCIGNLRVQPIELSHPKNGGLGYRIEEGKSSFVFLTDNELGYKHRGGRTFKEYVNFCSGADLLIHDAEYTEKEYGRILKNSKNPWGHSLFTDATKLAVEAGVKRFGLFHHNQKRTDSQINAMVRASKKIIEKSGSSVDCFAVGAAFKTTI